jgi:hypothetical protein
MDNDNNIAIARVQTDIEYIKKSVDKLDKNMEDFHKIFTTKDEHQENKKEIMQVRETVQWINMKIALTT